MATEASAVSPRLPKYRHIYQELHKLILSGAYSPGQKMPSEAELVERFGASRLTVTRAIKELQIEGLVYRRTGSGTYVRQPEPVAGHHLFGLIIPDLGQTEIFESICQGMTETRQSSAYSLLWGKTSHGVQTQESQAERLCENYIARKVTGVFFAPLELTPAKDEINCRIVEAFDRAGIPVILLDRDICTYPARSRYDLVGIDNRRGGYVVTEHLLKLGCKRIVFIGRPSSAPTVDARIAGYREALSVYRMQLDPGYVQRVDPADQNAIRKIMTNQKPDAFVCANDHTAGLLMQSLATQDVSVPEQVRIVGIDDTKYAVFLPVALTTLHQPCREIGVAAAEAMFERLAYPAMPARDILINFHLIVRQSCGSA